MSTRAPLQAVAEASGGVAANSESPSDLLRTRAVRFALGTTASAAIAFAIQWPLFFLAPVLTAYFLAHPATEPPARHTARLVGAGVVAFGIGLAFSYLLLPYPLVHVALLGLVLFRAYLWVNRGGSPNLVAMSLVAVMILPLMSMNQDSRDAGLVLSLSFLGSAGLAVFVQWMAHVALPDPGKLSAPSPRETRELRSTAVSALKSTLVVLPIAVLFLVMNWASEVLVLVFVAIFSLTAEAAESRTKGKVMLAANLIGAASTLVFYWLIVAVPEYAFFVTLMLLTMLCFGRAMFALDPLAEYMTPACIALLVLIAGSMTPQADFMDRPFERIVMISLAALYAVAALGVLDRVSIWREERAWMISNSGGA
jgi:hypothetical protein